MATDNLHLDDNLKDVRRVSLLRLCQELLVDIIKGYSVTVRVHEEVYKKHCGRSYKQILREMRLALKDSEYPDPNNYCEAERREILENGFRSTRRMN
tara:strand:- start:173 stop:463 length:291 start_codon:yes stop_codon:yes gene_type:complete